MKRRQEPPKMTPRQAHADLLLRRYERLLRMAQEYRLDLNETGRGLLERCIYATYVDCLTFDAGEEADRLSRAFGAEI